MIKVITHTPVYVWILLFLLLQAGWKSRKTHIVSWTTLLIMSVIMVIWSFFANSNYSEQSSLLVWIVCLSIGVWLGSLTVRSLQLKFDKQRNLIEIAGNWTPMILSMSIFALRYFLGVTYGMYPALKGDSALLIIENIATIVSGMFTGRLIGYWHRSKKSPHVDFIEMRRINS